MNNYVNQDHRCNLSLQDHLKYVDNLVLLKIIDTDTGKSIKQNMAATFSNNRVLSANTGVNPAYCNQFAQNITPQCGNDQAFDFTQSEFLKARECLLNYLQNSGVELDEAGLKDIEALVLELEKNALTRENKNRGEELLNSLNRDNELAKDRLITGSMQGANIQKPLDKLFSREEIAKMSTAEFIKNEPVINYQLQNGLI